MSDPNLQPLKNIAARIAMNSDSNDEIAALNRTFELFNHETHRLENAYQSLKEEFTEIHYELEKINKQLMDKVAELDMMRAYHGHILNNISQGLIFIDLNGDVTTYNQAAEEMLSAPIDAVLHSTFWQNFDDELFGFSVREALANAYSPPLLFTSFGHGELEVTTTFISEAPELQDSQVRKMQGIVVLLRDITEIRALQKVAERNERMRELGVMAAMVAHEIRNPLGGIKGFAALLRRDLAEQPERRAMAEHIIEGTDALNRVVTNVLDYARPATLKKESVNLLLLVEELKSLVIADSALSNGIELQIESDVDALPLLIDYQMIKGALLNLVTNAIQSMPAGGVITIAIGTDHRVASIEVIDNGSGIAPEHLEEIFHPFFTTKSKGSGFGLAGVHKIIQAHGGEHRCYLNHRGGQHLPGDPADQNSKGISHMSIERILVVDDEQLLRDFLTETLRRKGVEVDTAGNGAEALALLNDNAYDLIITDMKMPDITGIDLLRYIKESSPDTIVVVITAFGSVDNAVEAMRLGAFHYLIKPFSPDTIEALLEKAREHQNLVAENHYLRSQVASRGDAFPHKIIAASTAMQKIMSDVERVAKSNASVFIHGESGTGKEVIAAAIHHQSLRVRHPFIKVNCAAIPETLVESEFFGHEKGAFTGAHTKRLGRFELAHNGSLLLDEVTEVPALLQAKLLRVLQEREFERVGGTKPIQVDVRIIATSNRNIEEAITTKVLREDLYYRLNVVPIYIPPLRERPDDIIPLCEYFVEKSCIENHLPLKTLTPDAKVLLLNNRWRGNARSLANVIERAVVMDPEQKISAHALHLDDKPTPTQPQHNAELPIGITLKELEKRLIIETLEQENHNRTKTAQVLDISVRTLRNKLNEYKKEGA